MVTDSEIPIDEIIVSLDDLVEQVKKEVDIAVSFLVTSGDYRLFVAERLYLLGTVVIEPLHELYQSSDDKDLQFTIALLLVRLNDLTYVDVVIEALNTSHQNDICLIANFLAKANVRQASTSLINKLHFTESLDHIYCLILAIKSLDGEIPQDAKSEVFTRVKNVISHSTVDDFDMISKSLQIVDSLGYTLDESITAKLLTTESYRDMLRTFGYDIE